MKEELVSVIIPAYNVSDYIEECIWSLLCQTYTNYEIIIIDDGSTDDTYNIGCNLALENERLKIYHQENQGVSIARNVGMQKANGEYYIFVDADDVVAPQYIETLVAGMEKADLGMIGFTAEREKLEAETNISFIYDSATNMIENILCGTNYDGYLWNKIFRRIVIEKYNLKFEKNIVVWEDMLFVLEYLKNCDQIAISNDKLYYYRYREGSAVNNVRIEKYQSKYEVMAEIKRQKFGWTSYGRKRVSFLYFETLFSYLNQLLSREVKIDEIDKILSDINFVELLKHRNVKIIVKYLYLRIMTRVKH